MKQLSKPELVRERVASVCIYHHWKYKLWKSRMDVTRYGMDAELLSCIANDRDKTYQRIDDIMFGHPCGVSIA